MTQLPTTLTRRIDLGIVPRAELATGIEQALACALGTDPIEEPRRCIQSIVSALLTDEADRQSFIAAFDEVHGDGAWEALGD